jgi:membrane protein YqaA with SNARE-associated domain
VITSPAAAPVAQFASSPQTAQFTNYPVTATPSSNTFSIWGIVLGSVAFLFLPVVFGPVGIILSAVGKSKNESRSTVALTVSIVGTVMGMILGWIIGSSFWY